MTKPKKTKLEIIEETAEYYKTNPRGMLPTGGCVYLGKDGVQCAVGRCFSQEVFEFQKDHMTDSGCQTRYRTDADDPENPGFSFTIGITNGNDPDSLLKEEYQGHPAYFWSRLQSLHDIQRFWEDGTLTPAGEDYLSQLKRDFTETNTNGEKNEA